MEQSRPIDLLLSGPPAVRCRLRSPVRSAPISNIMSTYVLRVAPDRSSSVLPALVVVWRSYDISAPGCLGVPAGVHVLVDAAHINAMNESAAS